VVNRAIGDASKFETLLAEYTDDTSGGTVHVKLYNRDLEIGRE